MLGHHRRLLILTAIASLTACSGGSSAPGSSSGPSAPVDLLLGTSGVSDLFALHAGIDSVKLVRPDGTRSGDLLVGGADVELVGLGGATTWMAQASVEIGSYEALEVNFDPASIQGIMIDGSPADIEADGAVWTIELEQPLDVQPGSVPRMHVDIDLPDSLVSSAASSFTFDPAGSAAVDVAQLPIEGLRGIVFAASLIDEQLTIDAFLPNGTALGLIDVLIDSGTGLFDTQQDRFASSAEFFASLSLGASAVDVRGSLDVHGSVHATRIDLLEDLDEHVELEGMVLHVADGSFVMLIRRVVSGIEIARPALENLGNPSSIDVFWNAETHFVLPDGTLVGPGQLQVGQIVDARFEEFVFPPFVASEVEFEDLDVTVNGTIVDIAGLPRSFVMHVNDDEPRFAGLNVGVQTAGATIVLDVHGDPSIEASQLLRGVKVKVTGQVIGDAIDASAIVVRRGRFHKANVAAITPGEHSFDTDGSDITNTFGDLVSEGPLRVWIEPRATFGQDASSESHFYDLFEHLQPGERLDLKVRGMGAGSQDEVIAFEIKAKVRHDNGSGS